MTKFIPAAAIGLASAGLLAAASPAAAVPAFDSVHASAASQADAWNQGRGREWS